MRLTEGPCRQSNEGGDSTSKEVTKLEILKLKILYKPPDRELIPLFDALTDPVALVLYTVTYLFPTLATSSIVRHYLCPLCHSRHNNPYPSLSRL